MDSSWHIPDARSNNRGFIVNVHNKKGGAYEHPTVCGDT